MKQSLIRLLLFIDFIAYIPVYWIVLYIGLDKIAFELSSKFSYFASHKVVYDMFLLSIVVSLILAQVIALLNYILFMKSKKAFRLFNWIHLPLIFLYIYLIYKTEAVIPFIKNWHVALLGSNYNVGGF